MATVLLVDDQLDLLAIHRTYLEQHGHTVVTAIDGVSAIEHARAQQPDIIFLDHALPGNLCGVDVARELKRDPRTSEIPILMLTGVSFGAVGRRARAVGCVAFLSKPCPPARVLREIHRFAAVGH